MSIEPTILVENLSKSFEGRTIIENINFSVVPGESLSIIGGSGSGKSVLLKCLVGLLLPDQGSKIIINDEDLSQVHISKRKNFIRKFSMLFQGNALFDSLNIWQNITFLLTQNRPISDQKAREVAVNKLEMVGLSSDIINLYPSEISGGMQKRVALARAIATSPKIMFFDEPTTGLDPIMADAISELIAKLTKELNSTTIAITHDMNCMRKISRTVALIDEGTIGWYGDIKDISQSTNKKLLFYTNNISV